MTDLLCPVCNHSINLHETQGCRKRKPAEDKTPGDFCPCKQSPSDIALYEIKPLRAQIQSLLESDHQEVDEFNAGYDAFEAGQAPEEAEQLYHHTHEEVPQHDTFSVGYAWAKFQKEQKEQNENTWRMEMKL